MAVVLCLGTDDALLATRRMILERAGHRVLQAKSLPEVVIHCTEQLVDVVVLGQGVPSQEKLRANDFIRAECPHSKILELHTLGARRALRDADASLPVPVDVPSELSQTVEELAKKRRRPARTRKPKEDKT